MIEHVPELLHQAPLTLVLPAVVIVGAWLLAKISGFSWGIMAVLLALPIALPLLPIPLSHDVVDGRPMPIILLGWGVVTRIAVGGGLRRPFRGGGGGRAWGFLSTVYSVTLFCSAACVVVLYLDRALLDSVVPNWRATFGLVLLSVTAITVMFGLLRIARAMSLVLLWGFVALVLATEIFFGKLPLEFLADEMRAIDTDDGTDRFETAMKDVPSDGTGVGRIFLLGGANAEGIPSAVEGYFGRLERWFKARGERLPVNLAIDGASTFQLQQILDRVSLSSADTVVVAPPFIDSRIAPNAFGELGVSELDTVQRRRADARRREEIGERLIRGSLLARMLVVAFRGEGPGERLSAAAPQSPRLRPEERELVLQNMLQRISSAGARAILVTEPTLPGEIDRRYGEVVERMAASQSVPLVQLGDDDALRARMRFLRGPVLSPIGQQDLADAVIEAFQKRVVGVSSERQLVGPEGLTRIVRGSQVGSEVVFDTQVVDPGDDYFLYSLEIDGKVIEDRRQNTRAPISLRFSIPASFRQADFLRLRLSLAASPPAEQDRIGRSSRLLPIPVQVEADSRGARIQSGTDHFVCSTAGNLCVARIEPATGTIREVFDQPASAEASLQLGEWLRSQEWGAIVVGGVFLSRACPECVTALRGVGVNGSGEAGKALAFMAVTGERGERADMIERPGAVTLKKGGSRGDRLTKFALLGVKGLPVH
jgi:hypothetical protein